jgi:hypothetical protein
VEAEAQYRDIPGLDPEFNFFCCVVAQLVDWPLRAGVYSLRLEIGDDHGREIGEPRRRSAEATIWRRFGDQPKLDRALRRSRSPRNQFLTPDRQGDPEASLVCKPFLHQQRSRGGEYNAGRISCSAQEIYSLGVVTACDAEPAARTEVARTVMNCDSGIYPALCTHTRTTHHPALGTMPTPPSTLYRIYDRRSMSKYNSSDGFRAKDQSFRTEDWDNRQKMMPAIQLHLDWASTPFISTSASHKTTLREAERRSQAGLEDVHIAIIDFAILEGEVKVSNVERLVDRFMIDMPQRLQKYISTAEYLCLGRIPCRAVERICDISEFREYSTRKGTYLLYRR